MADRYRRFWFHCELYCSQRKQSMVLEGCEVGTCASAIVARLQNFCAMVKSYSFCAIEVFPVVSGYVAVTPSARLGVIREDYILPDTGVGEGRTLRELDEKYTTGGSSLPVPTSSVTHVTQQSQYAPRPDPFEDATFVYKLRYDAPPTKLNIDTFTPKES